MEKSSHLKLLFLILAGGGPEHLRDEGTQRLTWASKASIQNQVIWLKAGRNLEFIDESSTLYIPCEENELLLKTWVGSKWCMENLHFDILIRTNVSTYFNVYKLNNYLESQSFSGMNFGGHFQYTKLLSPVGHKSLYISGTGIFMGVGAVKSFITTSIEPFINTPDDIAITQLLRSNAYLNSISIPRLSLSNHHIFIPKHFYIRCKTSWNPDLASKRMKALHRFFESKSRQQSLWCLGKIFLIELNSIRFSVRSIMDYLLRVRVSVLEAYINTLMRK